MLDKLKICVVGLGYVGLPLAVEFAKKYPVTGFDINSNRIFELSQSIDRTEETSEAELLDAKSIKFSSDPSDIAAANFYIVTVPTPIDSSNRPDLRSLMSASRLIGSFLQGGDYVVYESTVYPGATEDICVPILESESGLILNKGFFVGYSPERINPGDKQHRLNSIVKVTSGSTKSAASFIDSVYASIITAGTHCAESIQVAEAAKVIENTQRDLNIALVNELAIIFNRLQIDTAAVLRAAGTKWNFLNFRPGLVGGHCIGVDPYYLTYRAQEVGYHPELILAGRKTNDGMAEYIATQFVRLLIKKDQPVKNSRILVLGFAFKENCPDVRNTKVIDIVTELESYGALVDIFDPRVSAKEVELTYGRSLVSDLEGRYNGILLAVAHDEFANMKREDLEEFSEPGAVVYDVKGLWNYLPAESRL